MKILVQNQKLPYFTVSHMNEYSGRHIRVALTISTISEIFSDEYKHLKIELEYKSKR